MRELGERPGTTLWNSFSGLPVEVYARGRGMSPSWCFREPVHLSAFLLASFPKAHESNIWWYSILSVLDFPSTKPPLNTHVQYTWTESGRQLLLTTRLIGCRVVKLKKEVSFTAGSRTARERCKYFDGSRERKINTSTNTGRLCCSKMLNPSFSRSKRLKYRYTHRQC